MLDWTGGLHARASTRRLDEARGALSRPSDGSTTPPHTAGPDSARARGAPVETWPRSVQSGGGGAVQGHRTGRAGTKVCPQCAESVKAAALVCRYCGHLFAAAAESPGVVSTTKAVGAAQGDLLCPDCGRPNPTPDRFCSGPTPPSPTSLAGTYDRRYRDDARDTRPTRTGRGRIPLAAALICPSASDAVTKSPLASPST